MEYYLAIKINELFSQQESVVESYIFTAKCKEQVQKSYAEEFQLYDIVRKAIITMTVRRSLASRCLGEEMVDQVKVL